MEKEICTSFCKIIIAGHLRKRSTCSICLHYFSDLYWILYTHNFWFICIWFLKKKISFFERDTQIECFIVPYCFIFLTRGFQSLWSLGKLVTHINIIMTMLNMHHYLLKFHVYMSLDWVTVECRMCIYPKSYQVILEIAFCLMYWMPCV